jgi:hypothetical protein
VNTIEQARVNVGEAIRQAHTLCKTSPLLPDDPTDSDLIALAGLILNDAQRIQEIDRAKLATQSGSTKRPSTFTPEGPPLSCIPEEESEFIDLQQPEEIRGH